MEENPNKTTMSTLIKFNEKTFEFKFNEQRTKERNKGAIYQTNVYDVLIDDNVSEFKIQFTDDYYNNYSLWNEKKDKRGGTMIRMVSELKGESNFPINVSSGIIKSITEFTLN